LLQGASPLLKIPDAVPTVTRIRPTRLIIPVVVALLSLAGVAEAAPDDPWVAYVANSVVNRAGSPSAVILRADPATGALVEVSRNGPQGNLFRHPYDVAVAPGGGSLYVVDMGEFASGSAPVADGRVIRVDPATGAQRVVSWGGQLVDPAGLAVAPNGSLLVVENVGVGGNPRNPVPGAKHPAVIRINPATGAQTVVARGAPMCYPFGIAVDRQGGILVTDFGSLADGSVVCTATGGGVIGVNPVSGAQQWRSFNGDPFGNLFLGPIGIAVEPSGTVLVANQRSSDAAVEAVNPATGLQQTITPNASPTDTFEQPQRVAVAPDGNLVVSDYALNTREGGLVSVVRATGEARILRSGSLFNNPLGVAVVVNRPPVAALTFSPRRVAGGRPVTFDASASTDPERLPLRYDWDLDGNGRYEISSGAEPRVSRAFDSSTTLIPRVRVRDPHGGTAEARATAMLTVDAIRPVLSRLRSSARRLAARARARGATGAVAAAGSRKRIARAVRLRFRVSERVRVSVALRRARPGRRVSGRCVSPAKARKGARRCKRWRRVTTLGRRAGPGPGNLRFSSRVRKRRLPEGRYRVVAVAIDRVGNRSKPKWVPLSVVSPGA
jgi:DNA-binding beta-propeller fold protein YncE